MIGCVFYSRCDPIFGPWSVYLTTIQPDKAPLISSPKTQVLRSNGTLTQAKLSRAQTHLTRFLLTAAHAHRVKSSFLFWGIWQTTFRQTNGVFYSLTPQHLTIKVWRLPCPASVTSDLANEAWDEWTQIHVICILDDVTMSYLCFATIFEASTHCGGKFSRILELLFFFLCRCSGLT